MFNLDSVKFNINNKVRSVFLNDLVIGNKSSISFMSENNNNLNTLLAFEIPFFIEANFPDYLFPDFDYSRINDIDYQFSSFILRLQQADKLNCDLISIKFNIDELFFGNYFSQIKSIIFDYINKVNKNLILRSLGKDSVDKIILPFLSENLAKRSIIAYLQESNYADILPSIIKNNHIAVLRTPIDINIAKELNILSIDLGLDPNNILIDTDIGGLGYGLDYGFSMMEKIRLAAFDGDNMLNMPFISFLGEEVFKAKELKADFIESLNFGEKFLRGDFWEVAAALAVISAGADIVVLSNKNSINSLKEVL